ncbi:FAD-dependent oxidoreductase [Streptomyces sp. CA-253872]|uniref:FAD-dependent oxidoreductase n=1 Tax=Streptomyces sp. CA-253872 TaxID=3240067 RepID=UPI003D93E740
MSARSAVLIVGAGPCGLAAAVALRKRGVGVRIIDAADTPVTGSRALQLWPGALDVLRELDVLDEAERRGTRVTEMVYHLAGSTALRVRLGGVNEPLLLPQEQTNEILEARLESLGVRVERALKVTDVARTDGGVSVKAERPDGTSELLDAEWLIGADGVRSTVREALGIGFPGEAVPSPFLIAEGRFDDSHAPGGVHYYFGRTGSLVFAPMHHGVARAGFPVPEDFEPSAEAVRRLLAERGATGMRLTELTALSKFASHERIAEHFVKGRCLLVGDAAHTHAAVGGQGLNLGLQDVRNLAWRLAGVLAGRLDPAVFSAYDTERRHAAAQTVRNTRQFVRLFTVPSWATGVRDGLWRALESAGVLRRWFAPLIAGRRIHYPRQAGARGPLRGTTRALALRAARLARAGERTPPGLEAGAAEAGDALRLCVAGSGHGRLAERAREFAGEYPDLVTYRALPGPARGFVLLRPDGYVAASGTTPGELAAARGVLAALAKPRTPTG